MPLLTSLKKGLLLSAVMTPIVLLWGERIDDARAFGMYLFSFAVWRIKLLVATLILVSPRNALETVLTEKPVRRAMSFKVVLTD